MTLAIKLASDVEPALEAGEPRVEKDAEAFRTIGEAATELGLKTHVLRFWETKFPELKPMKRADGRRFYRPEDMAFLRMLQNLLHVQGLTIRGAIKVLRERGVEGALGDGARSQGDHDPEAIAPETQDGLEGADMADLNLAGEDTFAEAGHSVRDLQAAVREAVERGDFVASAIEAENPARTRLESLLTDLTDLKSRLDLVRTAA